ncbi:Transcription factor [Akanthomyces lecanii RCEF 1005]|uniref:Transcription factor n=1 Tax=Akanthomyces lecanii RCEF 1005 TaxID=1081108 RepID=A0A162KAN4_CORDF|nr:Transcription factor [Akanthomyces lecanii RCEF 1005]
MPGFAFNEEHEATSRRLEGIGTLGNPALLENVSATRNEAGPRPPNFQLPTRDEAMTLSQYFLDNVQYLHPVFQPHCLQRVIDAVYMHPHAQVQSKVADVALLLSMIASASHLWRPQRSKCLVFLSAKEAASMSLIWSNAALDILEYSKRTTAVSIEDLQATIVISYVIYNSQGFSPMFRSLHSNIIMMARDLSLHKTDSPRKNREADLPPFQIEADVKRRLWWHIAATDWLLAFTPGPQEGTYSIQPSQMHVSQPRDLESCDHDAGTVSLLPTSYFFQRVRLAEICRAVVDSLSPLDMIENANYEKVIFLDGKFEDLVRSLPAFFSLDHENELLYTAPQLTLQRYLIHLGIYTRRSRLHQPFVVAGFTDPKYTFSRTACLASSRTVLQICHRLEEKKHELELIPARLATVVHHVFMAVVVLVMDLCSNKVEGLEEQRQAEVIRACRMLDSLKQDSAMAAKLAHPLIEILQKHKERLQQSQSPAVPFTVEAPPADSGISQVSLDPSSDFHGPLSDTIGQYTSATIPSGGGQQPAARAEHEQQPCDREWEFDAMMQQYIDLGENIDGHSWSSLFDDLDSHHTTDTGGAVFYG